MSVGAAFDKIKDEMDLTDNQKLFQTYEEHVRLEHEYSGDINTLSVLTYDEGKEFEGEDQLIIGGYDGIVAGLLKGLKVDIKLQRIV